MPQVEYFARREYNNALIELRRVEELEPQLLAVFFSLSSLELSDTHVYEPLTTSPPRNPNLPTIDSNPFLKPHTCVTVTSKMQLCSDVWCEKGGGCNNALFELRRVPSSSLVIARSTF